MYTVALDISEPEKKKLVSGGMIMVKPHKIGGPQKIVVSEGVASKIADAYQKGKPVRVKLSEPEIKENIEGGFLPQLAMMLAPALAPAVGSLASNVVGKLFGSGMSSNILEVKLSSAQMRNIKSGKPIQLSAAQLKNKGPHQIALHPMNSKKIMRAMKQNKGVRLIISSSEVEGGNLMNFFKGLASTGKKVFDVVSPILKPIVAPLIKQGLTSAAQVGAQKIGEKNKFLGDIAASATPAIIEGITAKAGLGMRRKDKLQNDQSVYVNSEHPAMNPIMPYVKSGKGKRGGGGSGFKPSGY
jgi:hypothetical protein